MIHIALSDYSIESITAVSALDVSVGGGLIGTWRYADAETGAAADCAVSAIDWSPSYIPQRVIYSNEFEALEKRVADLEELVKNLWQAKSVGDLL